MGLQQDPTKTMAYLVLMEYGDGFTQVSRYTDAIGDLTVEGFVFSSRPTMEVIFEEETGGVDPQPHKIIFREDPSDSLLANISSGEAHSEVRVTVQELYREEGSPDEVLTMANRFVSRVRINPSGDISRIEVYLAHVFLRLQSSPAGIIAIEKCIWAFLAPLTCQLSPTGIHFTTGIGAITNVSGASITLASAPAPAKVQWIRGYIQVQGLRLMIRHWVASSPLVFHMNRLVPARWLGLTPSNIRMGCRKTLDECKFWGNEEHIMNAGYAMPATDPNIEIPAGV